MAVTGKPTRQTGWPNFQLKDPTDSETYPLNALRTGYESWWDRRKNPNNGNQNEYLLHELILFRVEVNTRSTVGDHFEAFRLQQTMFNPVLHIADPNSTGTVRYIGTWQLDRIMVSDGLNATSSVQGSAEKEALEWVDKDGNPTNPNE